MKNQNWFGAFFYFYIPGWRRETSNEGRTGGYIGLSNCFNKNPWQDNGGSLYLPWFPFLSLVWLGVSLQTAHCTAAFVRTTAKERTDLLCSVHIMNCSLKKFKQFNLNFCKKCTFAVPNINEWWFSLTVAKKFYNFQGILSFLMKFPWVFNWNLCPFLEEPYDNLIIH